MFDGTGGLFLTYSSKYGAELLAFGFEAVPVAAAFFGSRKLAQAEVVAVRTRAHRPRFGRSDVLCAYPFGGSFLSDMPASIHARLMAVRK